METTEFKVGDVVRVCDGFAYSNCSGKELAISVLYRATGGPAAQFEKPNNWEGAWPLGICLRDVTLVRRAPASPAQEAPAKCNHLPSCRNRPCPKCDHCLDCFCCPEMPYCAMRAALKAAPMPSGSAGKEERRCTICTVTHSEHTPIGLNGVCSYCADHPAGYRSEAKPDPYAQHREKLALSEGMIRQRTEVQPSQQEARKRNIAALARELDQPSSERRARVHPHEGRSDRVYLANRRSEP